jgi:hypothetical protein
MDATLEACERGLSTLGSCEAVSLVLQIYVANSQVLEDIEEQR